MNKKIKFLWITSSIVIPTLASSVIASACDYKNPSTPNNPETPTPTPKPNPNPSNPEQPENPTPITPEQPNNENIFNYEFSSNLVVNKATEVTLKHINDGDTFTDTNNNIYRFAGIDTPETKKKEDGKFIPTTGEQFKYGKLASFFTMNRLTTANKIFVVPITTKTGKDGIPYADKYGRVVAKIYYQSDNKITCLNTEILKVGYAKMAFISKDPNNIFYTDDSDFYDELLSSQRQAQTEQIGIWSTEANIKEIYPAK
ncbi:Thermonuclease precursor [Metamycoplasma cloacale]|uniref:Uncharacterized protein n=1 Tax=Metamycoplasma cloacale TaxID=92401 RepID=A0A2Z4LLG8_9BACT|nr:thermonuclease family protein [Metamycoplasma cloacale]AWX42563.1 hypothetical protein DK849_00480 [Metamycoplasma cloacale]VEU79742.1 Thermonuclease precursor [Metamycoplasma cloacale]